MMQLQKKILFMSLFLGIFQCMTSADAPNTVTGLVENSLDPFSDPRTILFSPNGTTAYIVNYSELSVDMIDLATNTVVSYVDDNFSSFDFPDGLAITADGSILYISNNYYDEVCIVTTVDNVMVGRIDDTLGLFDYPMNLAMTPDGTKMYALNGGGECDVVIIDLQTNSTTGIVNGTALSSPSGIAITPDGTKAYVIDSSNNDITIIDVASDTVIGTIGSIDYPLGIAITPDGTKAYVANYYGGINNTGFVSVIDIATDTIVYTIEDDAFVYCQYVSILPSGMSVYVSNAGAGGSDFGSVAVIDPNSNLVTGLISDSLFPFNAPNQMGISLDGSKMYVSNQGDNTVSVIFTVFSILPPTNLVARTSQNTFLSQINLINVIGFDAPQSGVEPVLYKVYRDGILIGTTAYKTIASIPSTFVFLDENRQYSRTYRYEVTSVDSAGNESAPVAISITTIDNPTK